MSTSSRDSTESIHKDGSDSENDVDLVPAAQDPERGQLPPPQSEPKPNAGTDWDGPDDPEDPMNWPEWIRLYQVIPPALISFVG